MVKEYFVIGITGQHPVAELVIFGLNIQNFSYQIVQPKQ